MPIRKMFAVAGVVLLAAAFALVTGRAQDQNQGSTLPAVSGLPPMPSQPALPTNSPLPAPTPLTNPPSYYQEGSQAADPLVVPPMPTLEQLKDRLKRLHEEEQRLASEINKKIVADIEQLRREEANHIDAAAKCRAKREALERQLQQSVPSTPSSGAKCNPSLNGTSGANEQKQVFEFGKSFFR